VVHDQAYDYGQSIVPPLRRFNSETKAQAGRRVKRIVQLLGAIEDAHEAIRSYDLDRWLEAEAEIRGERIPNTAAYS
jgi:hypothetical protein